MPYTWRLAGLYALGRRSRTISAADLESAAAVAKYMMETVEYVFSEYQVEARAQTPERTVEPYPFDGDPSLAQESKVLKLVEMAKAAGEAGEKSGRFQQNMNVNKDMLNHIGAAAQERGLVKRYRLSRGTAGGHTYLIVYTGPKDEESTTTETPKPAKPVEPPKEVVEERVTSTPPRKIAPKQAPPVAKAKSGTIRTKPLGPKAPVTPARRVEKANGSGKAGDLLAGFFS
jgi:hypothetical protein